MLPLIVAATTLFVAALIVGSWLPPRLALRRQRARLRAMSPREFAEEAQRSADVAMSPASSPKARSVPPTSPCPPASSPKRRSVPPASPGIRKHFPRALLFDESQTWTTEALAKALDELYADLSAADQRNAEAGPGSFVYSFYDFGLASIRTALQERVARGSGPAV